MALAICVNAVAVASYWKAELAFTAFLYAVYFLIKTMVFGDPVKGFPTLIEFVLLLGGLQLMAIGIMGEYIGRMYIESKRRPIYLLDSYQPPAAPEGTEQA